MYYASSGTLGLEVQHQQTCFTGLKGSSSDPTAPTKPSLSIKSDLTWILDGFKASKACSESTANGNEKTYEEQTVGLLHFARWIKPNGSDK